MIVIACCDDFFGMAFNKRRVSRDKVVTEKIMASCPENLLMNEYSAKLFKDYENKKVSENFLEEAKEGDFVFIEDVSPLAYEEKIEKIILYRWNREYPADVLFDIPLNESWHILSSNEFEGFSHEKITMEEYVRNEK